MQPAGSFAFKLACDDEGIVVPYGSLRRVTLTESDNALLVQIYGCPYFQSRSPSGYA